MNCEKAVNDFKEAWAKPTVENLTALLHDEVILRQSGIVTAKGKVKAAQQFQKLLAWMPTIHGEVTQTQLIENTAWVEWKILFPFKSKTIVLAAVDKLLIDAERIKERDVYVNPAPLIRHIFFHPVLWIPYANFIKKSFAKREQ